MTGNVALLPAEGYCVTDGVHHDGVTLMHFSQKYFFRKRILHLTLNGAFERSCSVLLVKSRLGNGSHRFVGEFQIDGALQTLVQIGAKQSVIFNASASPR